MNIDITGAATNAVNDNRISKTQFHLLPSGFQVKVKMLLVLPLLIVVLPVLAYASFNLYHQVFPLCENSIE